MTITLLGDFKKLEKCVLRTGVPGKWRKIPNHQVQYRTDDDAILNWWKSTGTVAFQGPRLAIEKLKKPFVQAARRKGLLKGKRDTKEEIASSKRQVKRMQVDIDELEEVVARI